MEEEGARSRWLEALGVGAAVALLHVVLRPDVLTTLGTLYDDVVYLSLGKAIASGEGYRSIHLVGSPVHAKFPPFLPTLYAGVWLLTDSLSRVVYSAYALSMLALVGAVATLWAYTRVLSIRRWLAAVLVVGPLLLLRTVRYFAGAVSEPWFLLGWGACLLIASTWSREASPGTGSLSADGSGGAAPPRGTEDGGRSRAVSAAVLGLVLAATITVRTQALVLLPAFVLTALLLRLPLRAPAVMVATAAVPLALWRSVHARMLAAGPVSTSPDQSPYLDWVLQDTWSDTLFRLSLAAKVNPGDYLQHGARLLVGWTSGKAEALLVACGLLALCGMVMTGRRRPELAISVLAIVGVLLVWPFSQARFLTTLIPVSGVAAAWTVNWILDRSHRWIRQGAFVVAAVFVVGLGWINLGLRRSTYAFQQMPGSLPVGMLAAADWVRTHTATSDHILADYGAVYFLRTGRETSIGFPEQPFTIPSLLVPEGRYLARRLLADSVDVVVDARPSERRLGATDRGRQRSLPLGAHAGEPGSTGGRPLPALLRRLARRGLSHQPRERALTARAGALRLRLNQRTRA